MVSTSINVIPTAPIGQVIELGKQAENLGFEKFWVMDEGLATSDVYIALTAIAQQTSSIMLGTGITNPYTRHPAVTAASIATLDELTGGRAMLGIGAGGSLTLDPLGIERRKPLTAVKEMIKVVRALYRGETVTYKGDMVSLVEARIDYARPAIQIWVAGRGPKMLAMGGEMADGVALSTIHKDLIQENIDLIKKGASSAGNKPMISYATYIVTSERQLERLKPYMTFSLVDSPLKAREMIGISDVEIEEVRQVMGSKGLYEAGKLLKAEWLRPFIVMGSKTECVQQLNDLKNRLDIDELLLPIFDLESAEELIADGAEILAGVK